MKAEPQQRGRGRRWHGRGTLFMVVILSLGIAVVAAACSSSSPPKTVASLPGHTAATRTTGSLTQAQSDQALINFARCLRSHGVAEPDPSPIPGRAGLSVTIPTPGPNTTAALAACNHFIASLVQAKQANAAAQLTPHLQALIAYAQCMRSHNIAMLDPDAQGVLNLGTVPGITSNFGRYSPQFHAADAACRGLLPSGVHDNGTGP